MANGPTVTTCRELPAPPAEVWKFLTQAAGLSRWFANPEGLPDLGEFRFDFGDGDFFRGRLLEQRAPELLRFEWRFMGLARLHEVTYSLRPGAGGTELALRDHGAGDDEEARELAEGWGDFLNRLEAALRTGQSARFRWSPELILEAQVQAEHAGGVCEAGTWAGAFPGAGLTARPEGRGTVFTFRDDKWGGLTTQASLRLNPEEQGAALKVRHVGWDRLPADRQLEERRRYAALWVAALERLVRGAPGPARAQSA
jgi:uncharacterized protein YndB with AHSA1/START domain